MNKNTLFYCAIAFILGSAITFGITRYFYVKSSYFVMLLNAQETFINNETYIRLIEENKLENATNIIKSAIYCKKILYSIAFEKLEGKESLLIDGHLKSLEKYKSLGNGCEDSYREIYF